MPTHNSGDDVLPVQPPLAVRQLEGEMADPVCKVLHDDQLLPLPLVLIQEVGDALVASQGQLQRHSVRVAAMSVLDQVLQAVGRR